MNLLASWLPPARAAWAWRPTSLAAPLLGCPQAQFNLDAPYLTDAALKQKLRSLHTFLDLREWLLQVLPPPPGWQPPRGSAKKRKVRPSDHQLC